MVLISTTRSIIAAPLDIQSIAPRRLGEEKEAVVNVPTCDWLQIIDVLVYEKDPAQIKLTDPYTRNNVRFIGLDSYLDILLSHVRSFRDWWVIVVNKWLVFILLFISVFIPLSA